MSVFKTEMNAGPIFHLDLMDGPNLKDAICLAAETTLSSVEVVKLI